MPDQEVEPLSPELQASYDRLMHDLEHTPAITCPITYNWHGNQELADRASIKLRIWAQLMQQQRPEMSFAALKAITFHHDYELAIVEAAGADRTAPTPSKEAGGFSVGMIVRNGDGVHLVMHESVAMGIASEDNTEGDWAQHIVRHELCHVSDFEFKRGLIAAHPEQTAFKGFDAQIAPLAESLWDEYYANKYSSGGWSDPRTFLDLLRDTLPPIRADVIQAILRYRTESDLDSLLAFAKAKIRFVAQVFGYAAGSVATGEASLLKAAPEEHAMLEQLGLLEAWNQAFAALEELDATRPNWESALALRALFPACVALLAGFGLFYEPYGEGAYVDIPMTDETNPLLVAFTGDEAPFPPQ